MKQSCIVGFQLENDLDVVRYGIKKAREAGARTLLDPAPARELPDELYPYINIITLGKQGAVLVEKDKTAYFPARQVTAVDTTGAGDCFSGALMAALADGTTIEDAIEFAHIAASISVTTLGVVESIPTKAQVEELKCQYENK